MSSVWSIILAAGAGRRLASLTGGVPKQFWSGSGGRSLLDETLARFESFADRSRTVVIADASHRAYMKNADERCGTIVFQPRDCGTAAGVLLAMSPVLAYEPDSTIVITPSDHGVEDTTRYLEGVHDAVDAVRASNDVVIFGVEATAARDDYGWILPGVGTPRPTLRSIARFVEKPEKAVAERLLQHGAAWNTMVIAARARTLRDLCLHFVPALHAAFDPQSTVRGQEQLAAMARVYADLPHFDLSRDVLTHARTLVTYTWPEKIGWSDLGTPERMLEWLGRRRPSSGLPALTAA